MPIRSRILGVAVLALAGAAGSTQAATITNTYDTTMLVTDLNAVPLTVQLFNTDLGTLNSVSLSIVGYLDVGGGNVNPGNQQALTTGGTIVNNSSSKQTFGISEQADFQIDSSNSALNSTLLSNFGYLGSDPNSNNTPALLSLQTPNVTLSAAGNGGSVAYGPENVNNAANPVTTTLTASTAGFSAFEAAGGGSASLLNVSTFTEAVYTVSGGNLDTELSTYAEALAKVTYSYTPVSTVAEPASLAVVGSGLIALSLIAARGRRRD